MNATPKVDYVIARSGKLTLDEDGFIYREGSQDNFAILNDRGSFIIQKRMVIEGDDLSDLTFLRGQWKTHQFHTLRGELEGQTMASLEKALRGNLNRLEAYVLEGLDASWLEGRRELIRQAIVRLRAEEDLIADKKAQIEAQATADETDRLGSWQPEDTKGKPVPGPLTKGLRLVPDLDSGAFDGFRNDDPNTSEEAVLSFRERMQGESVETFRDRMSGEEAVKWSWTDESRPGSELLRRLRCGLSLTDEPVRDFESEAEEQRRAFWDTVAGDAAAVPTVSEGFTLTGEDFEMIDAVMAQQGAADGMFMILIPNPQRTGKTDL